PPIRPAGISGLASVALLVPAVFVVILAGNYPAPDASASMVVDYVLHHRTAYLGALFAESLSFGFFLWFLGGVYRLIERTEDRKSFLAPIAFGGGLLLALSQYIEDAA